MKPPPRLLGAAAFIGLLAATPSLADGLVEMVVQRFAQSELEFVRARNNVPFLPIAWASASGYNTSELENSEARNPNVTARQWSIQQGAFVPIAWGQRDAIVFGEWLSYNHFDLDHSTREELEVVSASIPVGWIRQASRDWQVAAFVAPLAHKTPGEDWYWETLGGVFARNLRGERFAWIVGAYFDVSPLEDFYTPYLGATYTINERWTLNAIMPWPSVMYAPTTDTLFRLGVSPSGTSWSVEPGERRPRMNLSSWNFGISAERRVFKNVWVAVEAGVAGLRGLSIVGGDWEPPETQLDSTGYAAVWVNIRPGSLPTHEVAAGVK